MRYFVTLGAGEIPIDVTPLPTGGLDVRVDGRLVEVDVIRVNGAISIRIDNHVIDLTVEGEPPHIGVVANGKRAYVHVESDRMRAASAASGRTSATGDGVVTSPMPGRVVKILVSQGEEVSVGTPLVIVEAMKMENELSATRAGTVSEIFVSAGDTVEGGAKLIAIG